MNKAILHDIVVNLGRVYKVNEVIEKNGIEVLGTRLSCNKPSTGGVSRAVLREAYENNNCCPRLKTNVTKKRLVQALMRC
jgi:hypothetical protein